MNNYTYLAHHGVKGMKWGVRRYQDKSGTLTDKGIARYRKDLSKSQRADSRYAKAQAAFNKWNVKATKNRALEAKADKKNLKQTKKGNSEKAERYVSESTKRNEKAAKYEKKAAKYQKMIAKNEKIRNTLGLAVSDFQSTYGHQYDNYKK